MMSPADAMEAIVAILNGTEWSPDTPQDIADVCRAAGYVIDEHRHEQEE